MTPDSLTFLGVIFSGVIAAAGTWVVARIQARSASRAADATAEATTLGHVVQRMRDQDARIAAQQTQIDGQRTELDRMHDHTREQDHAIRALQRTEGRLVGWVARLHHGIADGTIPPLPEIPDWLTGLLSRRPHDD